MKKIKVLIVDDSAFARKMLTQMLASDPEIEVVGTAMDGIFALNKIRKLKPDIVTLDISMPRMDGSEALKCIMDEFGLQVIIVSSHTKEHVDLGIRALEMGAFDLVAKPGRALSPDLADMREELIRKIKAAYKSPLDSTKIQKVRAVPVQKQEMQSSQARSTASQVLAIGASTGGPNALTHLLPCIPKDFPAGILIVQHMPAGFIDMFASRLNAICKIEVKEARDGDLVLPGRALIAPSRRHLKVRKVQLGMIAVQSNSVPENGHKPSVDVLYRSVAEEYGKNALGLILTGMGQDGAEGIGAIKLQGGLTVAQDENSCVVFGMPKAAIEKNNVVHVLSLEEIGRYLVKHFMGREVKHGTVCC